MSVKNVVMVENLRKLNLLPGPPTRNLDRVPHSPRHDPYVHASSSSTTKPSSSHKCDLLLLHISLLLLGNFDLLSLKLTNLMTMSCASHYYQVSSLESSESDSPPSPNMTRQVCPTK